MSAQQFTMTFALLLFGAAFCCAAKTGGMFLVQTILGDAVEPAFDAFNGTGDVFRSQIYLKIHNYMNYPLSSPNHKMILGNWSQAPGLVKRGYTEAWSAKQQDVQDVAVEGISSWTINDDQFCFVYFRVEFSLSGRDPNELAISCVERNSTLSEFQEMIKTVKSSSNWDTDEMIYYVYDNNRPTIQHCNDFMCIQGTMTSSFKCEATLSFFPRRLSDLAQVFQRGTTQKNLDDILRKGNPCKSGCGTAVMNEPSPFVLLLVAAMLAF